VTDDIRIESAEKIDDYISKVDDCQLKQFKYSELNGRKVELQAYRLPLDLLCYNIRNGRFAAELMEKEESLGRRLNPEKPEDEEIIEELFLADKNQKEYLTENLKRLGQIDQGVITHDGRIINGNRRVVILKKLFRSTGEDKYNYFETYRLPPKVSHRDLWRIETGIQLSFDLQAKYGPINELFKIKQGKESNFSYKQIALILGGSNTEDDVKLKLKRLELIEDYLKYVNQPHKYSEAERRNEYFINLQKIMKTKAWKSLSTDDQTRFLHATYEAIRVMVGHLKLRRLGKPIKDKDAIEMYISETFGKLGISEPSIEKELEDTGSDNLDKEEKLIRGIIKKIPQKKTMTKRKIKKEERKIQKISSLDIKKQKKVLIDVIDNAVELVEVKEEIKKPKKLVYKVNNIIRTLSEIDADKLKPLKKDLEDMCKSVQLLIKKIES